MQVRIVIKHVQVKRYTNEGPECKQYRVHLL